MRSSRVSLELWLWVFLCGVVVMQTMRPQSVYTQTRPSLVPPENIQLFTLGHDAVVADSLWLRVLQDVDFCGRASPQGVPSVPQVCEKSWVYQVLRSAVHLTPRFRALYVDGGLLLSVVVNDRGGASAIFAQGLKQFPNDWVLAYRAAYHALFETQDRSLAAALLQRAAQNGGPSWLYALAGRLWDQVGQKTLAREVLLKALEQNPEGPYATRLRARLKEIEQNAP